MSAKERKVRVDGGKKRWKEVTARISTKESKVIHKQHLMLELTQPGYKSCCFLLIVFKHMIHEMILMLPLKCYRHD